MPSFPWSVRRGASEIADAALEGLLAGGQPAPDTDPALAPVAGLLDALRAGPTDDELTGEAVALAAFRETRGVPSTSRRQLRRRRRVLTHLLSVKAAAAAAAAALSVGGLTTAAYAGSLPGPVQRWAHDTIGAPPASGGRSGTAPGHATPTGSAAAGKTPTGPSATGDAAFGLCTAYAHAKEHGTASERAVAFRNLAEAAGGAGKVASYCATVPHPGASPSQRPQATRMAHAAATAQPSHSHPTPTAHPTHSHPTPTPHPSHTHPTPNPRPSTGG